MSAIDLHPADYLPSAPPRKDFGIGLIGCGGIARTAHLPAYRQCGYNVVAACDLIEENVQQAQTEFGIPHGTARVEDILNDEAAQIIDLAVHGKQRLPLIEQICATRPPHLLGILSQKPLAMNWRDAVRMVEVCREAELPLMVNQQARWAPAHRALRVLIDRGLFGHIYCVTHFHRAFQDHPGSWFVELENFNIIDHGIHYIDLCRYFTQLDPIRVKATATMQPGQLAMAPLCHTILLEFPPEAQVMAVSYFNNIIRVPQMHRYEWFIDGSEVSAMASRDELIVSYRDNPRHKQVFSIEGSWFPDAFGGSMGELMRALDEGREPQTSGRDNLHSIQIAYAAVESTETGEAVALEPL
ncbi:MAG: oxidoreductase [Dehalococcoidia bacterium]|nr:oxidoreductase [Dehalococcoidia bacterium]